MINCTIQNRRLARNDEFVVYLERSTKKPQCLNPGSYMPLCSATGSDHRALGLDVLVHDWLHPRAHPLGSGPQEWWPSTHTPESRMNMGSQCSECVAAPPLQRSKYLRPWPFVCSASELPIAANLCLVLHWSSSSGDACCVCLHSSIPSSMSTLWSAALDKPDVSPLDKSYA